MQLGEAMSARELGDSFAKLAARGGTLGLIEEVLFELGDVDRHGGTWNRAVHRTA